MKHIVCLTLFIFIIACGQPERVTTPSSETDNIQTESTYTYSGILKIYRASSGCIGSGGSHIEYQQVIYQKGSQSTQAFTQLIDNLFNNNELYDSFEQDGCFNFYHLNFNGELTQELIWTNGSEIMRNVIHIKEFQVK